MSGTHLYTEILLFFSQARTKLKGRIVHIVTSLVWVPDIKPTGLQAES